MSGHHASLAFLLWIQSRCSSNASPSTAGDVSGERRRHHSGYGTRSYQGVWGHFLRKEAEDNAISLADLYFVVGAIGKKGIFRNVKINTIKLKIIKYFFPLSKDCPLTVTSLGNDNCLTNSAVFSN